VKDPVASVWERLDTWLADNAPPLAKNLRKGASPPKVAGCEKALGRDLPPDVRASLSAHDGEQSDGEGCLLDARLLSVEEIEHEWKMLTRVHEGQADWFSESWIPIATYSNGDYLCVETAQGRKFGAIVEFVHDDSERRTIAKDMKELLAKVLGDVERGRRVYKRGSGIVDVKDAEPPPAKPAPAASASLDATLDGDRAFVTAKGVADADGMTLLSKRLGELSARLLALDVSGLVAPPKSGLNGLDGVVKQLIEKAQERVGPEGRVGVVVTVALANAIRSMKLARPVALGKTREGVFGKLDAGQWW
jgi:cell wall assembly regulator SMI1